MNNPSPNNNLRGPLLTAVIVMLILVLGWYFLAPALGIVVGVTAGALGIIIGTVIILCVAILLFHVFAGIITLVIGFIVFVWCVVAIALFPVVFPVLVPLLIIMFFVGFVRRRRNRD